MARREFLLLMHKRYCCARPPGTCLAMLHVNAIFSTACMQRYLSLVVASPWEIQAGSTT
jgi:hypothetical protein